MLDEILEFNKQFVANKGYENILPINIPIRKSLFFHAWIPD